MKAMFSDTVLHDIIFSSQLYSPDKKCGRKKMKEVKKEKL